MRGQSFKHTLRKLQKGNKSGDVIGITLPKELPFNNKKLEEFIGVKFTVSTSGNSIILTSGCVLPAMSDKELKHLIIDEKKVKG